MLATSSVQVKASALRGLKKALEARALLAKLEPSLSPDTRGLLAAPPPGSSWISHGVIEELALAVVPLAGVRVWRELSYHAARDTVFPVLRVATEAFLRLFGATPAALLGRMNQLAATSIKGLSQEFAPDGDRGGVLTMTYERCQGVPVEVFHGAVGPLQLVFDLTGQGRAGHIDEPQPHGSNGARVRLRW